MRNFILKFFASILIGLGLYQSHQSLSKNIEPDESSMFLVTVGVLYFFYLILEVFDFKLSTKSQVSKQVAVTLLHLLLYYTIVIVPEITVEMKLIYSIIYIVSLCLSKLKSD